MSSMGTSVITPLGNVTSLMVSVSLVVLVVLNSRSKQDKCVKEYDTSQHSKSQGDFKLYHKILLLTKIMKLSAIYRNHVDTDILCTTMLDPTEFCMINYACSELYH